MLKQVQHVEKLCVTEKASPDWNDADGVAQQCSAYARNPGKLRHPVATRNWRQDVAGFLRALEFSALLGTTYSNFFPLQIMLLNPPEK